MDSPEDVDRELDRLHDQNPQRVGLLRTHLPAVRTAVESCDRNYPDAGQLYAALPEPTLSRPALGNALGVLADLGVLGVLTERETASNRYDLTAVRFDRLDRVEQRLGGKATGAAEPA